MRGRGMRIRSSGRVIGVTSSQPLCQPLVGLLLEEPLGLGLEMLEEVVKVEMVLEEVVKVEREEDERELREWLVAYIG